MINPDYLKTLIALAENKSFTETAAKLHMTQPGVSQHIQKLEEYFQANLILRVGKKFTLTEAGQKLIDYSVDLFSDHEVFKGHLGKDDPYAGSCKYSSPGSFGLRLFDALILSAKKYPDLSVSFSVAPNASIPQMIISRQIDVGFMTKIPSEAELEFEKHGEEELLLIVPKGIRIKRISDLIDIGFVNHPDGTYLNERLLMPNFPDDGRAIEAISNRVFVNQINRILDPVAEGLGFTVLPEGVYRKYFQTEKLSIIKLKIRVKDEIYRVKRINEKLPQRYKTVEEFL